MGHHREEREIVFPPRFSFIEAPEDALQVLGELVSYSLRRRTDRIGFVQRECSLLDLCAESAASVLALEAQRRLHVQFRGVFPARADQREIASATGLPKQLGAKIAEPEGFLTFELCRGRRGIETATKSSQREYQSGRLTEYVNRCLARYGFVLKASSAEYLSSLVGEVIGNAEDHADRDEWWIAGYLRHLSKSEYGDCHITIFNFGKTLSESLQQLPDVARLRLDIEALVAEHGSRGWFGPQWTEENLWTLYALQEGVSRHNDHPSRIGDRGRGTVDMITFFQKLGQSAAAHAVPKMCVISGSTHVLFDGRYEMQPQLTKANETRHIIAFNAANDLSQPPDPLSLTHLSRNFPGTLISLRFYLDKKNLAALEEHDVKHS